MTDTGFDPGLRLLLDRGADELAHPGGTLGAHLRRVGDALAGHGVAPEVRAAGLCHAAYGTDGFPHPLLTLDERPLLRAAVGAGVEAIVYQYCSCDRARTYPHLTDAVVPFADRFTTATNPTPRASLVPFAQLTVANERDVLAHASLSDADRTSLDRLLATLADLLGM